MIDGSGSGYGSGGGSGYGCGYGDLEGCDAIGVAFRERGGDVNGLAQDHRGVPLADALFENAAALVGCDDVEECGHHVHGGDDNFAAVRQDQGDLVVQLYFLKAFRP